MGVGVQVGVRVGVMLRDPARHFPRAIFSIFS